MTDNGLPPLRDVIARHGLAARKGLGQNFLLDLNLTRRIARAAAPLENRTVIEVGPGPGGLTRALLSEGAAKVIAIEKDSRAIPALQEISAVYPDRVCIVATDALKTDMAGLASGRTKIVSNLPYNIATPLLISWLTTKSWPPWYESMTLMFQKEVADRIVANPGSKAYGRLSVLSQWRSKAVKLFDIDRRAFTPPPKVTSSLVQFFPAEPSVEECNGDILEIVTQHAFGQRRKMLRSSLKALIQGRDGILEKCGIDPSLRAEQLQIADFCRLAVALEQPTV